MTDPDQTITFSTESLTDGYPALVDDAFRAAIRKAAAGGADTKAYFDALDATSSFWGLLATKRITFADGTAPDGRKVRMASSGNVELRVEGAFAGSPGDEIVIRPGEDPPAIGIVTVTTRNTTTNAAAGMAIVARLATMPVYLPITAELFAKLLVPIYGNVQTLLGRAAAALQRATSSGTPSIDAMAEGESILEEQSGELEQLGEDLAEEGLEFLSIEWGTIGLDAVGLGALMAIPMLVELLGHEMTQSLVIQNMSSHDFTIELTQVHGDTTFHPGTDKLPGEATKADPLDDGNKLTYSYGANYHFINYTNLGAIGYVITLRPTGGGTPSRLVVSIPWAGDNALWVGTADGSAEEAWTRHATADGRLVVPADFGSYKVTLSLDTLRGQTDGAYHYCSMALIE